MADGPQMTGAWQDRKRRGRPSAEDAAAGRCLSAAQIASLPEGAEVEVVWSGGNGPHRYRIARVPGFVTTAIHADAFDPRHDALFDARAPGWMPAWVEKVDA